MEHVYLRAFFKHETVEHVDVLSARDKIQKRRVFVPVSFDVPSVPCHPRSPPFACGRPPRREETNDETLRGAANFVDNQASWRTEETDPRCSFSTLDDFGQECKALTGQQVEERTPLAADTVNREERDQLFIPSDRAPTLLFVTPNEQTAATA